MRICYLVIFLALFASAITSPIPLSMGVVSLVMTMMTHPTSGLTIFHPGYSQSLSYDDGEKRADMFNLWKMKMMKTKKELENIDGIINNSVSSESSLTDDFQHDDNVFFLIEVPLSTKRVARSPEESGDPGENAQEMGQKGMGMASKGMQTGEHGGMAASEGAKSAQSAAEGVAQGAGMAASGGKTLSSGFGKGKEAAGSFSGSS